ncbi:PEP-CTERM sorting domain-containing protein [Nostoc sp. MS1]|uniref:PEP-CTERM sorting domain-containing protein n=1 Tax=Nostoc sp. MS1 TaxID=2764711 RepID=UPI001CC4FD6F|nr:PEP-CTERM sorting domain-containing protein [Nostoc sp. MS1]BCL36465.1 hypothetical protein NSMS1_29120 [Nostoc sp. MS1]
MEESVITQINTEVNSSGTNSLSERSPLESLYTNLGTNVPTGVNNIPGGGVNPFTGEAGTQIQKLISDRLKLILGDDFFNSANNPFLTGGGNPFVIGNSPVGNSNRDFGTNNATIGNFNSDFANDSATIGNGNWNFNKSNTTIGNGNWKFGSDNTTIGNGNWYWDDGSSNATLGNGNWYFGSDNATIGNGNWYLDSGKNNTTLGNGNWYFGLNGTTVGNGNWDFGVNNTIIGNGNWVFTSNNTIVGNGNWLVDEDNVNIGVGSNLNPFVQTTKTKIDEIINSLVGRIGQDFVGLTGNSSVEGTQTYNQLILSRNNPNSNLSTDIEQLIALLSGVSTNYSPYPPGANPQSVPEPTSSISLMVVGFICLLLSRFKKRLKVTGI